MFSSIFIRSYWVLVEVFPLFLDANEHKILLFILPFFPSLSFINNVSSWFSSFIVLLARFYSPFNCFRIPLWKTANRFFQKKKKHFSLFIHILSVVKFSLFMRTKIKCKIKVVGCCFFFIFLFVWKFSISVH